MASNIIGDLMLRREAELLRWTFSGMVDSIDDKNFHALHNPMNDETTLIATKEWGHFINIPYSDLSLSLDALSRKHLVPWVRELPSVKASVFALAEASRQYADVEYRSWK